MSKLYSVLILGVVAINIALVSAVSDEEKNNIRSAMLPLLASCGEEYSANNEDINAAKESKNLDGLNSCFYACVMKKIGTIDDQGLYAPTVAKATHRKFVKEESDVSKFDAITEICSSVNEQTVSDGTQGCERAKLVLSCLIKNFPEITAIF